MQKVYLLLLVSLIFNSCSLLKFSVETGETPLTEQEYKTRSMTRGLYNETLGEIIRVSDSIVSSEVPTELKMRAIRWKIATSCSLADKALQTTPDAALLDTWILSEQLNTVFERMNDSLLLNEYSNLARATFKNVHTRCKYIAKEVHGRERYKLMEEYVAQYIKDNPLKKDKFPEISSFLGWVKFLEQKEIPYLYTKGTTSEVISGMSEQVFGQVNQFANTIEWNKDIFDLKLENDSLSDKIGSQMMNLEGNFERVLMFMEDSPEVVEHLTNDMSLMLEQMLISLNQNVNTTFQNLDTQRDELQLFIDEQRETLIRDVTLAAEHTIQKTLDTIPAMVRSVLIYIILFVFIIFGAPFALGLWLGGRKERKRKKQECQQNNTNDALN